MNDELWYRGAESTDSRIVLHRVKLVPNGETDRQGRVPVAFADGTQDWVPRGQLFATKAEAVGV
ncbi:MAG: hypothetical protein ACREJO_03500 [Phycisphaerales bacterium]